MKRIYIALICGAALFAAACGMLGGSTSLDVKVDGREKTVSGTASYVTFTQVSPKGATFYVANFAPSKLEGTTIGFDDVKSDDQMRVQFSVIGGKESDFDVKPGVYDMQPAEKANRLSVVVVSYFKDNGEKRQSMDSGKGTLTISSVTDEEVSGTIDAANDKGMAVKGSFTAKRLKK